ncbi:hypothetical protein DEDE109153_09280 [Deinococcus deserti]
MVWVSQRASCGRSRASSQYGPAACQALKHLNVLLDTVPENELCLMLSPCEKAICTGKFVVVRICGTYRLFGCFQINDGIQCVGAADRPR